MHELQTELYYIIDSNVISEKDFDEKVLYDGYGAFEDSLTGEEIVDLLNKLSKENEQLKQTIINLIENGLNELFGDKYRIIEDMGDV